VKSSQTIPLARPDIGPEEEAEVLSVLRSGRLAMGPKTLEFERLMAEFSGAAWALAVSSGTTGLHVAVRALGVGSEDCVVMSPFTFISSANCVRYEGAEPVFLDIDSGTLGLLPVAVREYLEGCKPKDGVLHDPYTGRRIGGVISTDVFGHPADLEGILDSIGEFDIPLVSDSCESLGSRYRRRDGSWVHAGTDAVAAVFGFYPNKQITTGEGGMVTGNGLDLKEQIHSLRNQGRRPNDPWLRHTIVGFNYRIDELSAAVGVAQMRRVGEILGRRADVARGYAQRLAGLEGVETPKAADWADPAWFVEFVTLADDLDRDRLVGYLNANGVESKAYFDVPLHLQPPYSGRSDLVPLPMPVSEDAAGRIMILPFSSLMTDDELDRVCTVLRQGVPTVRSR
jgi:perosamine synthetase